MTPPATLANLVANDHSLRIFCDGCRRCIDLEVDEMVRHHGELVELSEIGRRSRRAECGAKGGSIQMVAGGWK